MSDRRDEGDARSGGEPLDEAGPGAESESREAGDAASEPRAAPGSGLDPDAAAAAARGGQAPAPSLPPSPATDARRYRWMIGIFGLTLVVAGSIYQFAKRGVGSPGVTAGKHLHYFVAPLSGGSRDLDANTRPRCDPSHPNPQGLNVCGSAPLVLAFFVAGSGPCLKQVDTLQSLSRRYAPEGVQFAAVAVRAGRAKTAALVRSHRWTIPVAYDRDGAVGDIYGVEICPLLELSYRGGIVADRLIGEKWIGTSALAPRVQALARRPGPA